MIQDSEIHQALKWIVGILRRFQIPYQVTGGLAARCYGSSRPLHDIDFYVPGESIPILKQELAEFIEFGPARHKDEHWDIIFMKLNYRGQKIEFGDAGHTRYFDAESQQWIKEEIDFSGSVIRHYEGVELPVMPKRQLIDYKRRLNRDVDKIDLNEIQSSE